MYATNRVNEMNLKKIMTYHYFDHADRALCLVRGRRWVE